MNIGQITQWFQLIMLILEYGKKVVDLAIEIYERIEKAFQDAPKAEPKVAEEKAARFDRVFLSEVKASPVITGKTEAKALQNVAVIREKVWATRPENAGRKARPILGQKPGSGVA